MKKRLGKGEDIDGAGILKSLCLKIYSGNNREFMQ